MRSSHPVRTDCKRRRGQRGTTLVESLVACLFAAFTAAGATQVAQQLRLHGDLARQRGEALRIADASLESARAWMAAASNPGRVLDDEQHDVTGTNATYRVRRSVAAAAGHDDVTASLEWADRAGTPQTLRLDSAIARRSPAYSAAIAVAGPARSRAMPFGRAATIPTAAIPVGHGHSAWAPTAGRPDASTIVFDDATGDAVALCPETPSMLRGQGGDLDRCTRGRWLVASGVVRFEGALLPAVVRLAVDGERYPAAAMCSSDAMKTMRLPAEGGALRYASVAIDAAPGAVGESSWTDTGERFIAWRCLVDGGDAASWSGRIELEPTGWTTGAGPTDRRVCSAGGGDAIDWRDVHSTRIDLNVRVAAAGAACPR